MEWTAEKPTMVGMYVFHHGKYWTNSLLVVQGGNFRKVQNPDQMYAGDKLLSDIEPGLWFGPIPTPPQEVFEGRDLSDNETFKPGKPTD